MSWDNEPEHNLNPEERAIELIEKFDESTFKSSLDKIFRLNNARNNAIILQKAIIKKLESHGIKSEYENQVLIEIKKL